MYCISRHYHGEARSWTLANCDGRSVLQNRRHRISDVVAYRTILQLIGSSPDLQQAGVARLSKRRFQPNHSFQYKEGYRGLTLDHTSYSRSLGAPGNGVVLYDGRDP